MNNLSWFIYFTELADGVKTFFMVASIISLVLLGISGLIAIITKFDEYMGDGTFYASWARVSRWAIPCALTGLFVGTAIPSQRTLVLMASSEIGERLAKSDSVNSIVNPGMDLIRKWIKQEADKIKDKS